MKILCEECYAELTTREYAGLGVYVTPCSCCDTIRERKAATAAATYVLNQLRG